MSHSDPSVGNPPHGATRVLLVDDDPHILKVFSHGLERHGFHVTSASTAKEALSFADPDVRIVVYCEYGKISTLAAGTLHSMGFRSAIALDGGIAAWRAAGHPVET